ncbi:MAG: DegT/DnrJ/EryC1/StrS family aminotransferase, partial [Burkholderiaceae bacterium]|nr:DegT/DnrJ/EryC1/StrS family aminotransferase [Burkholderiaceae bacterium]
MTMVVPMLDLARQHRLLEGELLPRWQALLRAGQFIGGAEVESLEREFAARLGVRHAVALNSGTDALWLALVAAGVGPGDEVITTPFSFVATAATIVHAGARPVFADIDPHTFNLSPASVARAVTARTKAILPVHLFGQPADLPALQAIARDCGAVLIEDCAQSFGATFEGRPTGSFGLAGAFSFYPTKNLAACGDGGIVATDDAEFAARLRRLANHGVGAPMEYLQCGYNSR